MAKKGKVIIGATVGTGCLFVIAIIIMPTVILALVIFSPLMAMTKAPKAVTEEELDMVYSIIIKYNETTFAPREEYEFPKDFITDEYVNYLAYRHTNSGTLTVSSWDIDFFLEKIITVTEDKSRPIKWEQKLVDDPEKPIYAQKIVIDNSKIPPTEKEVIDYANITGYEQMEVDDLDEPIAWIKVVSLKDLVSLGKDEETQNGFEFYFKAYSEFFEKNNENDNHDYPSGLFIIPVDMEGWRISSPYGMRTRTWDTGEKEFHTGTDIIGPLFGSCLGWPIMASADGEVIINDYDDTLGWYITIRHANEYISRYQHMREKSPIGVGTPVVQGDVIGSIGGTGDVSGVHLHWVIKYSNEYTDPMKYIYG